MSSLVCAVADTGIANAYGSLEEGWYVSGMAEGDLRPDVSACGTLCVKPPVFVRNSKFTMVCNPIACGGTRTSPEFLSPSNKTCPLFCRACLR